MRILIVCCVAFIASACVTAETVRFQPKPSQEVLMRDGMSAVTSRGKASVVTVMPGRRELPTGSRPIFIVRIQNTSRAPINFTMDRVQVVQAVGGNELGLKVFTYEELAGEERNAQVGRAILVGISGVAGGLAAGNSYWRQQNEQAKTAALAADVAAQGQANMAALEAGVIKDHTILPGEVHAGQIHMQAPEGGDTGGKRYVLSMAIGPDRHDIEVLQTATR
jgi:hypothetical protein